VENILLAALNPGAMTGRGNNTWLLDGVEPTLIDAGVGVEEHVESIARALDGRELRRVLVTHGHSDHASGVPALRRRWPGIEACNMRVPGADAGDWIALEDGVAIRAGDAVLTTIHTPGHALDHVCFWNAASRALYSGDMVVRGSTVMIPGNRGGGLRAYLASLERLAALEPAIMYPGHGPVVDNPLALINEYIEHRHLRDRQVAACLRDGVTDVDEIVSCIYPDLPEPLRAAARATIDAHVLKLKDDGI